VCHQLTAPQFITYSIDYGHCELLFDFPCGFAPFHRFMDHLEIFFVVLFLRKMSGFFSSLYILDINPLFSE
jgi:hypothetical protein